MNLEEKYISSVSIDHRKSYGQFYTSQPIAKFMMEWVTSNNPNILYDPAFGMGAFYRASKEFKFEGKFIASEIDKNSFAFYKKHSDCQELELKNEDYFSTWDNRWDAIICNPPYLKFQKFSNKNEILNKLSEVFNTKISGYTNIASAFLLKSIFELNTNGRLAYIMPLEFLNTGYGKVIKNILLKHGSIKRIIHVKDEAGAFDSVITTVCIIFFEKNSLSDEVIFSKIENTSNMQVKDVRRIKPEDLDSNEKWLSLLETEENSNTDTPKDFVPFNTYGKFKRGIATGANEFFSLTKSKIDDIKLEKSEFSLCITKSNQVRTSIFSETDLKKLIDNDSAIYVFNPLQDTDKLSVEAEKYIKYGESQDYHRRYLTKNRKNWYVLEKRETFPILFGVFSRGHYKIIRNETNALSLTCFHGFEPNLIGKSYIDKIFIFLKSDLGKESLLKNKRKYGADLDKFEPSDLTNIFIPSPHQLDLIPTELVKETIDEIRKNDVYPKKTNQLLNQLFK